VARASGLQHLPQDFDRCNYGYIGHVAEDPTGATANYTFTGHWCGDARRRARFVNDGPDATNPGIDCANGTPPGTRERPQRQTDASIDTEIAWTKSSPRQRSHELQPGRRHHRRALGIENPNMPAALHNVGVNVFAADASRQPQQYALSSGGTTAESARATRATSTTTLRTGPMRSTSTTRSTSRPV